MLHTLITTSYAGPTNSRGARIIVRCEGKRRVVPYDHGATFAHVAAVASALCVDYDTVNGWAHAYDGKGGHVFLAPYDIRL
jgi:hypothetical protein